MKRLTLLIAVALSLPTMIHAQVITEGELVVDLRAADLSASSTTWMNLSTSADSVGNFSTIGLGTLNVGTIGGQVGLNVASVKGNAVISSSLIPASLQGNSTRSVEAWLYVDAVSTSKSPVSWGLDSPRTGDQMSQFRYSSGANGFFTGWYGNDKAWTGTLLAGQWVYAAWVYDGSVMKGYLNGILDTTVAISPVLATPANTHLRVGAGRESGSEPFNGYLADVRVHTGVLSDSDVLNNFNQGMYPVPEPATFALLGLGGLALIVRRRRA